MRSSDRTIAADCDHQRWLDDSGDLLISSWGRVVPFKVRGVEMQFLIAVHRPNGHHPLEEANALRLEVDVR